MACFTHYRFECDNCGVQAEKQDTLGLHWSVQMPEGWLHFQVPRGGHVASNHHLCNECRLQLTANVPLQTETTNAGGSIIGSDGEDTVKQQ